MALRASNLTIGYGSSIIQQGLNFELRSGEMVVLLGCNGAGKSTLLRTLSGLLPALSGRVETGPVSLVLTDRDVMDRTTVRDVVRLGRYEQMSLLGRLDATNEQIVTEAMHRTGVIAYQDRALTTLSDGEQQRVLVAKALAQQSDVMVLDEPTAHLDIPSRVMMMELLQSLAHDEGKTIIVSTHELELALRYADRALLMHANHGGVELETAENLRNGDALQRVFGITL